MLTYIVVMVEKNEVIEASGYILFWNALSPLSHMLKYVIPCW